MWNDIFKGDDFESIIRYVEGTSQDIETNVVNIIFHSITPPADGSIDNIILGRFDSGIPAVKVTKSCFSIDGGSLYCNKRYNDYRDYMAMIDIYIPYCGIYSLDPNVVAGKKLNLKYIVDITSGACTCEIFIEGVLQYTFSGTEGCTVPFSMSNGEEYIASVASFIGQSAVALKGGVAGAAFALSQGLQIEQPGISSNSVNVAASISQIMPQTPYLIIKDVSSKNVGNSFNKGIGRLLMKTADMSTCEGLTVVSNPRIDTIHEEEPAMMSGEYEALMNCMKEGVIL